MCNGNKKFLTKLIIQPHLRYPTCSVSSVIGIFSGSPYVAHVLEYINFFTPYLAIDSNTNKVFDVILW